MDKEKEIEEMANFIESDLPIEYYKFTNYGYEDCYTEVIIKAKQTAENFINAGFGSINQFSKELVETAEKICKDYHLETSEIAMMVIRMAINKLYAGAN